jgi:hypothetical protein
MLYRIIYHRSIGSAVSLGFGFCLGLVLSVLLAGLDTANFVIKGWTHWTIMAIFLSAMRQLCCRLEIRGCMIFLTSKGDLLSYFRERR